MTLDEEFVAAGGLTDNQGNPINLDGALVVETIDAIDQLTDEDFTLPRRSVVLPPLPDNVDAAIGAKGKPVVIKKNIFIKNAKDHKELTPEQSRQIIAGALYSPKLYGQAQKRKHPNRWVVICRAVVRESNKIVLLEISEKKCRVEVVHWHYLREESLETIKRQAVREGGQILVLPSEEEAGGLPSRTHEMSSDNKDTIILEITRLSVNNK